MGDYSEILFFYVMNLSAINLPLIKLKKRKKKRNRVIA